MSKEKNLNFIGVISDTHGLMRLEALDVLRGADLILHAGDIGNPQVLEELRRVAQVVDVRGNNDKGSWAEDIPQYEVVQAGATFIYMLHDLNEIDLNPEAAGFQMVISGHSHRPLVEERKAVLYVNPGSAGPRRFNLPISVAHLKIMGEDVEAKILDLQVERRV
jgi:putative phosphoesterase